MGYELHIERRSLRDESESMPIPLDEWKAALATTKGVRLFRARAHSITNPGTGEVIRIPRREGDAEVYFSDERAWHPVFRWSEGAASFKANAKVGDSSDPVWVAAAALAKRLGAVIRGDEREVYDLKTGEVVNRLEGTDAETFTPGQTRRLGLYTELTLDYGRQTAVEVFESLLDIFQKQGFVREQFCTLKNSRRLEHIRHFTVQGSLFSEISFCPIANGELDLLCITGDVTVSDLKFIVANLVARFNAKQAFLHSAEYYHWQNAEQPMQYECAGKDHSMLPKIHNGLPPPLEAMWIDISKNPGRRYLRDGFQEAVSSPMWLRRDQITKAQVDKIRSRAGFDVANSEGHFCIRHSCSPFDETVREEQEFLRAVCFGRRDKIPRRGRRVSC